MASKTKSQPRTGLTLKWKIDLIKDLERRQGPQAEIVTNITITGRPDVVIKPTKNITITGRSDVVIKPTKISL
jgi:hypothetical protein